MKIRSTSGFGKCQLRVKNEKNEMTSKLHGLINDLKYLQNVSYSVVVLFGCMFNSR